MGHSSRRSSSSSSSSSGGSDRSVESIRCNVKPKKLNGAIVYLAGGDPRKHKHFRKDVIRTERDDGTWHTEQKLLFLRDPYGATYYFSYEDDSRSQYRSESRQSHRSGRSSKSSRSNHGGGSRGPSAMGGGVAPMPMPQPMPMPMAMPMPMQQGPPFMGGPGGMPMPMNGGGGMGPMGMGPPPMQGPPGGGIEILNGMEPDDDYESEYGSGSSSGSSYMSGEEDFEPPQGHQQQQMPPMGHHQMHMPPMHMPHMMNQQPPPMHQQGGGVGDGGQGFFKLN